MSGEGRFAGGATARYLLMGVTLFLLLFGLVMIYSAAFVSDFVTLGDSAHHLKRQAIWIAVSLGIAVAARFVDYHKLRSLAWWVYGVAVTGLVAVLAIGVEKWGAKRWIDLGLFTIQPSEYAKLGCVMITAMLVCSLRDGMLTRTQFVVRLAASASAVTVLVMLQPDMGTTMAILLAVFVVLFLGGTGLHVLSGILLVGVAGAVTMMMLASYRAARFVAFLDPWSDPQGDGYQTIQALLAFGSGGVDGIGLGMSRQKFFYLPAAHTDFIFAIIGEELGLLGTLSVVLAFALFAYAGIRIALGARDTFGRLIAGGLTAMIVLQAVMNMAAVTNLMPVTGIPMPLVSFGGSSMSFTMLCVGLILSVSSYGTRGVRAVRASAKRGRTRAGDTERRRDGRSHLSGVGGGRTAVRRRA